MLFDKEAVLKFLPHRDPFLFIDSVEKIESGNTSEAIDGEVLISPKDLVGMTVVANFFVDPKMPILAGHFPGNPILPGVVQVEMMGQAACFLVSKLYANPLDLKLEVALMGVNEAKFRKPVVPGMHLTIMATCSKARGPVMGYDCQILHENNVMSESSIWATVKL